jgi:hypothetical protein
MSSVGGHMLSYSPTVSTFLNDIEQHIPYLVSDTCQTLFKNTANVMVDIRSIILYGNSKTYLNTMAMIMIKKMFDIQNIRKSIGSFSITHQGSLVDIEYTYSDYHFELDYTDKHIKFIKTLISNKTMNNRPFIFVIKGLDENAGNQIPLKQVIDGMSSNVQFIFLTKNLAKIDKTIISRSMLVNTAFQEQKIYQLVQNYTQSEIPFEIFHSMYETSNYSIVSVLLQLEFGVNKNIRLYHHLDQLLLKMKKEKNPQTLIEYIREFVYKVYHLTIPLDTLMKYIVNKFPGQIEIIALAAQCSCDLHCSGNKTILAYERFFLNLPQLLPK